VILSITVVCPACGTVNTDHDPEPYATTEWHNGHEIPQVNVDFFCTACQETRWLEL
jgi:hypothetical protein